MKLPEFKAIMISVSKSVKMSESGTGTKQTVLVKVPARKITDEWGEEKEIREENYEMDVINEKIKPDFLASLAGKKVVILTSYLNGYEYKEKETGAVKYGKSMTLSSIKEFK